MITTATSNNEQTKLWAVRGATTISQDTTAEVLEATRELLTEIFNRNQIVSEDVVSIIFTVTPDIHSEFPAVAARHLGLTDTPLLCMQEIAKSGALTGCIRVLIHFYTSLARGQIKPVYLRDAVSLRPDLASTE
ncbi:MAG: chorismate mutase [Firmicutes bacterium]|nr:chorismate mutase [Bacillota bacterium]